MQSGKLPEIEPRTNKNCMMYLVGDQIGKYLQNSFQLLKTFTQNIIIVYFALNQNRDKYIKRLHEKNCDT